MSGIEIVAVVATILGTLATVAAGHIAMDTARRREDQAYARRTAYTDNSLSATSNSLSTRSNSPQRGHNAARNRRAEPRSRVADDISVIQLSSRLNEAHQIISMLLQDRGFPPNYQFAPAGIPPFDHTLPADQLEVIVSMPSLRNHLPMMRVVAPRERTLQPKKCRDWLRKMKPRFMKRKKRELPPGA